MNTVHKTGSTVILGGEGGEGHPLAVQKMFAPVAPLIACLKLQCSEVHVFLMCVMLRLRSCDCPEVKEGSRGHVRRRISRRVVLLPASNSHLPPLGHHVDQTKSGVLLSGDKELTPEPCSVADPHTLSPCLPLIGCNLLVGQPQF